MESTVSIETFLAGSNLCYVIITIFWKALGVPQAFKWVEDELFNHYYIVKREVDLDLFYLLFYGLGGFLPQCGSLYLAMQRKILGANVAKDDASKMCWKAFGLFHLAMAMYHLSFILYPNDIGRYDGSIMKSSLTVFGGPIMYGMNVVVAFHFLTSANYNFQVKVWLDLLSFLNFTPVMFFLTLAFFRLRLSFLVTGINWTCFVIWPSLILINAVLVIWKERSMKPKMERKKKKKKKA